MPAPEITSLHFPIPNSQFLILHSAFLILHLFISEVVAKCDHLEKLKFSKILPYAFTEHGAIMAASILNSPQATEASIFIVRAFVKLRQAITEHKELTWKISQIERQLSGHDNQIAAIIQTIKKLIQPTPVPKKRRIGFNTDNNKKH